MVSVAGDALLLDSRFMLYRKHAIEIPTAPQVAIDVAMSDSSPSIVTNQIAANSKIVNNLVHWYRKEGVDEVDVILILSQTLEGGHILSSCACWE